MSRKRKAKAAAAPRSRRSKLVVALAGLAGTLAVLLAFRYALSPGGPQVPDPDLSAMEPRVAAKIEEARQAVLAAPDSNEAWGRLGMVLHAHGLESDAAACYRRAKELAPSDFRWSYLLAHALRNVDAGLALAEAEAASRIDPNYAPAYVFRAQLLEGASENDRALEQYRKAVALDEKNALAEFGLGRLSLARGDVEEALRHLLLARELSEDAPAIHGALAQAYRQAGDMESALRENRLASEVTETISIGDPIHYAMRKESVASISLLERALDADRAGDFEAAEALYQELVKVRPDDANIIAGFGDTLARQSKIGPARERYEAALAINPQMASAHYGLGNMLNFEGDYEGAARHYKAALETRPEHAPTLLNLAGIAAFRGELEEAADLCRKALEIDPNGFDPNFQLGSVLMQQKQYRAAIQHLRKATESRPGSGPAHFKLAVALGATGDFGGAREHVEKAQELGEKVPQPILDEIRRRVGRDGA